MDYKEKITRVEKKIKNKAYESAEQDLLQIINEEEIKSVEDENNTYYTFYNYVETIIFFNRFIVIVSINSSSFISTLSRSSLAFIPY